MLSKYTLYECFGYILSPVFYCFFNILRNFAHCNISLAKKTSRMLNNFYCITKRFKNPFLNASGFKLSIRISPTVSCRCIDNS